MMRIGAAARSIAVTLPSEVLEAHVSSIHDDYINIVTDGSLITLFSHGCYRVPFGIEVEKKVNWSQLGITISQPVLYFPDTIVMEGVFQVTGLQLCTAYAYSPVTGLVIPCSEAKERLAELSKLCIRLGKRGGILRHLDSCQQEIILITDDDDDWLVKKIRQHCQALVDGVLMNNEAYILTGVRGLLGLGPGLTPSGDDFLLGFYCGIAYVNSDICRTAADRLAFYLVQNAPNLTTLVSVEYIRCGTKGLFHQLVYDLLSAFLMEPRTDMVSAARNLLNMGHFSGTDFLIGFIYGGFTALRAGASVREEAIHANL